jgi:hypothetical protein
MTDYTVVDMKGLRKLGITYARTHLKRLMAAGKFPKWFPLANEPKARKVWWLREIVAYLEARASTSNRIAP